MPHRFPPNLLDRSAPESARLLALSYLDQIDRTERRLADPQDAEALHDFRVGLRRLRSELGAYRAQLEDSVSPQMRRRVKKLARATNESRDVEVQLDWLGKQLERLGPEEVPGFYWLVGRLEDRKQGTHGPGDCRGGPEISEDGHKGPSGPGSSPDRAADRTRAGTGAAHLPGNHRQSDPAACHSTAAGLSAPYGGLRFRAGPPRRISMKRLRYLLEPISRQPAGRGSGLFKEGQDLLGEHHDMHILPRSIAALRTGLSASRFAATEPGLTALARLAEEGAGGAFERFQSLWGDDMASWILTRADELGQSLEQRPAPPSSDGGRPSESRVANHEARVVETLVDNPQTLVTSDE